MVVEVAATRILSVYFGNTIFTVSSVLSVILLALSLGYFIGGRLADKKPSELLFYQLIALSGLSVFLLQLLNITLIPIISTKLDMQYGPIIASLLLFLLPGFLLGMLSPLVAKLQAIRLTSQGIGQITGDVFFWSTLGSILGSLLTGFVLIPMFGVTEIILGTGFVLLAIGCLGMMGVQKTHASKIRALVLLITIPVIQYGLVSLHEQTFRSNLVYANDGVYDNIIIYDGEFNNRKVRFLRQATDASSAMYVDSSELVYDYSKFYEVYKLSKPDISSAMVIGGGAYSVPKAFLQADTDVIIDVAEIEPDMFELAKTYFHVPDNSRLVNHVEDGRRFLYDSPREYDVIFEDAYHTSIPSHLTTQEFLHLTKSKLSKNGVFIMNVIGRLRNEKPSFLLSQIKTFQTVYPNMLIFAVYNPQYDGPQNIILAGFNSDKPIDPAARSTQGSFFTSLTDKIVGVERFVLDVHPIFTDNYAPVEYFNALNKLH